MTAILPGNLETVNVGGWDIAQATMPQAVDTMTALAYSSEPRLALTTNMSHLRMLRGNQPFRNAYDKATVRFADGMPLVWLSRLAGTPLPERITGADLELAICERFAGIGGHVIYLGGIDEDVTRRAVDNRRRQFPGLRVSGRTPSMRFAEDPKETRELVAFIRGESDPGQATALLVCAGAPRSEVWAARNMDEGRVPQGVIMPAGAAIDFAAGVKERAPEGMQKSGLEWAHRLASEPGRLAGRYFGDAVHLGRLASGAAMTRMFGAHP